MTFNDIFFLSSLDRLDLPVPLPPPLPAPGGSVPAQVNPPHRRRRRARPAPGLTLRLLRQAVPPGLPQVREIPPSSKNM